MNKSDVLPSNLTTGPGLHYYYPQLWTIPSAIAYCCISLFIIIGNGLVIGSFYTNLKLRTKTYYFFVSLAIADLLIAVVSIPMWTYLLLSQDYGNRPLHKSYSFFDVTSGLSSIFNLTAISIERWYAITKPVKHRNLPKARVISTIFAAWFFSIFFASLTCLNDMVQWIQIYMFLLTIFLFFVPMGIIAVAYLKIFRASGKIMKNSRGGNSFKKVNIFFIEATQHVLSHSNCIDRSRSYKKSRLPTALCCRRCKPSYDVRNAITIGIVIGVFVICWLPFFVLIIIIFSKCCITSNFLYDMRIVIVIKMMHYGNSAANPLIYASRIPEFKRTFFRLINRIFIIPGSKFRIPGNSTMSVSKRMSMRKTSGTSVSNSTKRESTVPLYSDIFFISAV